jgi:hypothetical protein
MATTEAPITITQGATFTARVTLKKGDAVWDLTGATFAAKVATSFSASPVPFTVTPVDLTAGIVDVTLTAAQTAAIVAGQDSQREVSLGFWDLTVTQGGVTYPGVIGRATLRQMVSA